MWKSFLLLLTPHFWNFLLAGSVSLCKAKAHSSIQDEEQERGMGMLIGGLEQLVAGAARPSWERREGAMLKPSVLQWERREGVEKWGACWSAEIHSGCRIPSGQFVSAYASPSVRAPELVKHTPYLIILALDKGSSFRAYSLCTYYFLCLENSSPNSSHGWLPTMYKIDKQ